MQPGNINIEDVIKVENATSMCNIFSAKKNAKGQNKRVVKFNSRQLIYCLKRNFSIEVKMIKEPELILNKWCAVAPAQ